MQKNVVKAVSEYQYTATTTVLRDMCNWHLLYWFTDRLHSKEYVEIMRKER